MSLVRGYFLHQSVDKVNEEQSGVNRGYISGGDRGGGDMSLVRGNFLHQSVDKVNKEESCVNRVKTNAEIGGRRLR